MKKLNESDINRILKILKQRYPERYEDRTDLSEEFTNLDEIPPYEFLDRDNKGNICSFAHIDMHADVCAAYNNEKHLDNHNDCPCGYIIEVEAEIVEDRPALYEGEYYTDKPDPNYNPVPNDRPDPNYNPTYIDEPPNQGSPYGDEE